MSVQICESCGDARVREPGLCPWCGAGPIPMATVHKEPAAELIHRAPGGDGGFSWFGLTLWTALGVGAVVDARFRLLVIIFGLSIPLMVVHLSAFVFFGLWRRAAIEEIGIGAGGRLARAKLGRVTVRLNWMITSGYVKFRGQDDLPPMPGETMERPVDGRRDFQELRPWERLILNLSAPALVLAFAAVLIGPARAWGSLVSGFRQHLTAAIPPAHEGQALVAGLFELVAGGQLALAMGLMACKMTAGNLLPVPVLNGGEALIEAVHLVTGRPVPQRWRSLLQVIGLCFLLGLAVLWLLVLVRYMKGAAV